MRYWLLFHFPVMLWKEIISMREDLIMKKVLALVLAASMILSLAACGGSKSGSQPAEGTTAAAASATRIGRAHV